MPRRGLVIQARTRWLLVGLALLFSLVLLMYLLECAPQTDGNGSLPGVVGENMGKEYYQALLQEQEEHYQNRATSLKRQIAQLKQELQEMSDKLKSLQEKKSPKVNGMNYQGTKEQTSNDLLEFLHSQIDKAEVSVGAKLPSEYGVIPFESFTSMKVFQLEMGLTRHPEEKPVRKDKRDELVEVIEAGLEVINNPDEEDGQDEDDGVGERQLYSENDFIEAGVAFLAAGLWAWSEKGVLSDLTKVTGLHGLDPVVLVLVVGIVMFTLGFAGCVGALRENICLLKFFCGAIMLIFLLELAVAVLAFLFQDWVRDKVKEFFENNIKSYRDDIDLQNLIDSLQKINHCCGAQGPDDWDFNIYFNCSSESKSREKCGVPFSCCIPDPAQKVVNTQCGYDVRKKNKSQWDDQIFVKGCILALEAWLPRNIYIVAGVFIAISLLQIFGIFLARTLISDIEAVKAGNAF